MAKPQEPRREHPSTYFVQDRRNEDELTRLRAQDQMFTAAMGGLLPEQPDLTIFHDVLDVACGTGGWLIEMAKTYPGIARLAGVDVSSKMIEYARVQAEEQQVSDRVEFATMDALRIIEFPPASFDLVNLRLATSFLRTWDWSKLLQEFQRVARSKGLIRITESDIMVRSNSPALTQLYQLGRDAFANAGHFFSEESNGITQDLEHLLNLHGLRDVQTRAFTLEYRAGTEYGQIFYEDVKKVFKLSVPFLQKWVKVPENLSELQQQALIEMQQPDFVAAIDNLTAWGRPGRRRA